MSKKFKKLLSITLAGAMMLMIVATGLTTMQTASADDGTIYLLENQDGTYSEAPATRSIFSEKGIAVTAVDDDIFNNNENLYRKVNETLYIPTRELIVDLESATLENDLMEMGMLEMARNNIMQYKLNSEENGTALEIKVYTPSSRATRIYTGWNNNQYYENYYTITFQSEALELVDNLTEAK